LLGAAIRYSYLNAKTRTMHSKRLRPSDWHILEAAKDREGFLHYLATTSYGPWVAKVLEQRQQGQELFERGIFGALFDDYRKIERAIRDKGSKELILGLFSRFEAENLKIVFRAIFTGQKKAVVSHLLYPVEPVSRLPWDRLWQQQDVREAVKVLEKTPFGPMLEHALSQFEAQGRLFPLEMAMDIASFRRIARAMEAVSGRQDRKRAAEILGSYIDVLNICHVARLRFIYGLSPEEALNYSFPGGRELNLWGLHDIARARDLSGLVHALPASFRVVLEEEKGGLASLKLKLEDWLIRRLRKAFLGSPFHLGVQVAHLLEKEIEIRSLVSLFQAKVQGAPVQAGDIVPGYLLRGGEEIVQAG
jgi:V/A-type H+-transporting ATPase subunit C